MIILYITLALIILLVLSIPITFKIVDIQFKKLEKQEEKIKLRLTESLKSICKQLTIPLSYHNTLGTAAGKILYHNRNGRLLVDNAEIQILNRLQSDPWVLAHELGHYMAIKQREDDTEQGADKEARILCESILTDNEKRLMKISLDIFFHSNIQ